MNATLGRVPLNVENIANDSESMAADVDVSQGSLPHNARGTRHRRSQLGSTTGQPATKANETVRRNRLRKSKNKHSSTQLLSRKLSKTFRELQDDPVIETTGSQKELANGQLTVHAKQ